MFDKPFVQDAIFDLGITYIRVDVEPRLYVSGSTSVSSIVLSSSAVNDLVQQIQIARSHGIDNYIMSCWSPPAVWKDNGSIDGGHLIAADEPYYVNYYVKVLQTLQADGLGLPVGISVQNEPDTDNSSYDSCIYTDSGNGYALWRQLVQDMHTAFVSNGMGSVTVFGPESASTDYDIDLLVASPPFNLMSDGTFAAALTAYASHTYGENLWLGIRQGERTYPQDGWITEWSVDDNANDGGTENGWTLDTMAHMASNFVDIPYNYWTWWVAWDEGSTPQGTTLVAGTGTPVYSERYYVLQKLWTTVRPGWVVHPFASCSSTNFTIINDENNTWETLVDLVSFWNPTGTASTTMLVNWSGTATSMTVNGLVGSSYQAFQSDPTHNMVNIASGSVSGSSATVSLSGSSVTLLIATSGTLAPVTGLTAAPANPGVDLSWPVSYGATGYNVKRAATSVGPYTTIGSTGSSLVFTDTSAVAGNTYYYVVTALNPSGESASSNPANILVPYLNTAVANAYVQDGSYDNTNFGGETDTFVKDGPTGYNRRAYYRFGVSGLANAYDAQVWLMPDSVGATAYNTNPFVFQWVQNDTWIESGSGGITWNNKPAGSGTNWVNDYTGFFAGEPVAVDVTSIAKAQASVDGLMSMLIYSTVLAPNGDNWIQFATRENTTPGYHPVLAYWLQPTTREPLADSYVRDGSYANTNFLGDPDLAVKADATSYNRDSYLTFYVGDLGSAASVKLALVPDTVGISGTSVVVSCAVASNATWSESTITWNNQPGSSGSPFATIDGGFVAGQPVVIDVTSLAHTAAAGNGLLSIRLYGTDVGSNNWVNFGSRYNSNVSLHPVLEY